MDKILVTTDFSSSSKVGLQFAIQLASQHKYELTFFHSYNMAKPLSWTNAAFAAHEKKYAEKIQKKLNQFVESIYRNMKVIPRNKKCIVKSSPLTETNIREYAEDNQFGFICIGTRGAGKLRKLFGTNTSYLINYSQVPIIVVPQNYRASKIRSILYASDISDIERELRKVMNFAQLLKATVQLLHFYDLHRLKTEKNIINKAVQKFLRYNIEIRLENVNIKGSLIRGIKAAVKKTKPSMMIMFSHKNPGFFNKIFFPGTSAEYALRAKVPVIIFNKN